ncbi:MAG TPA: permease-like cell division protein FtsX [Chitinophagaceae bacterium]|nr:permease-like cell division protein FtsX [Chitinophagaceae bacterium]
MNETSKSSLRRSKPNYVYSIVGVAFVLFIMGIMGWLFLNFSKAGTVLKEDIRISAYLRTPNKDSIAQIQQYISAQPYAKDVQYVDKEKAKQIWNKDNNEDWSKILDYNPFPESIDFYLKAEYVNKDSLAKVSSQLMGIYANQITDLQYQQALVNTLKEKSKIFGLAFLIVSAILCLLVIFSIDNTIRLAMFSNRFLIKTMQMVGATRNFIAKPMDVRAVINGLISAVIAIALLFGLIFWMEGLVPELKTVRDLNLNLILCGGMILVGVGISLFSTHRSVIKYLKMKLDDLY